MNYLLFLCLIFYFVLTIRGRGTKLTCNEITSSEFVETFEVDFYLCYPERRGCKRIDLKDKKVLRDFLKDSKFTQNNKTTVIIHGYLEDHETKWVKTMAGKLLDWVKI